MFVFDSSSPVWPASWSSWIRPICFTNHDPVATARRRTPQRHDYWLRGALSTPRLRRQQPLVLPQHYQRSKNKNLPYFFSHWFILSQFLSLQNQRNYLIEDLITWKDYEIQMAAFNRIDVGKFSKSITVKTREGSKESSTTTVVLLFANLLSRFNSSGSSAHSSESGSRQFNYHPGVVEAARSSTDQWHQSGLQASSMER